MATIQELFKSRLKQHGTEPGAALYAYRMAKADQERGLSPQNWGWIRRPKGHGDVIRTRDASGKKRTFVIAIRPDETMGPPWEEHDGHGVVSEWTTRDKKPGEVIIASSRDRSKWFYDVQESIKIAKRDSWGMSPEKRAAFVAEYGREPTKGEIAARAVAEDCERMRQWCNDLWHWCGVCLIELDPTQIEYPENVANDPEHAISAALWGIESDSPDYHETVAYELLNEAIKA